MTTHSFRVKQSIQHFKRSCYEELLPEKLTLATANEYTQVIGDALGVDWKVISLAEFTRGLAVELEYGSRDPETNITYDSPLATGKIAFAHLYKLNDYYTRLDEMEKEK